MMGKWMEERFKKSCLSIPLSFNELSPMETEITEDGHAARTRLVNLIEELNRDCASLGAPILPMPR
jgi:hypothetical protein